MSCILLKLIRLYSAATLLFSTHHFAYVTPKQDVVASFTEIISSRPNQSVNVTIVHDPDYSHCFRSNTDYGSVPVLRHTSLPADFIVVDQKPPCRNWFDCIVHG